ncbi:MAG: hypothetical protein CMK59_05950 [Proteobacteria bacterium]|nr:hypothetical protein [Pseudomonadota bacterium]
MWILCTLNWAEATPALRPAFEASELIASSFKGQELVCYHFAEDLELCFRYLEGLQLPYLKKNNPIATEHTPEDLYRLVRAETKGLMSNPLEIYEKKEIPDLKGVYWASNKANGLDCVGLLHPVEMSQMIGGTLLAAVPDSGSCVFWAKENEEIQAGYNLVLAVGIYKMYENSRHPVSKQIYEWTGQKWDIWGEAIPSN